jgi:DNA polymerase II large subunit
MKVQGGRLQVQFEEAYEVARQARLRGLDPSLEPEAHVARDVAERVEKSVGPPGVASRIRELSAVIPREEVAIKVAEEIAVARFASEGEAAAEQAIRTAAAILDEGVTAAPLQGINSVKVKNNPDRTKYLALYFAGPIRSAGGTEMGLNVVVADHVRQIVGLDKYKATELDARRFLEELRLYEREVARFQFKVPDRDILRAVMMLPVEVTGVETDPVEVASHRNVARVETNRVRGGALRVLNDGLIGRSQKILRIVEKLSLSGWEWLRDFRQASAEAADEVKDLMFMEDIVAGRPVFSLPGVHGGFRLRYGRTRVTGMAAVGIHPATMVVLDDFAATGTQLRMEKPGKAGVVTPVDTIEPPIVKLSDGSVVRLESVEQARQLRKSVVSVLFLGDLLVSFGEFIENNRPLAPSGFTEEWWAQMLQERIQLGYASASEAGQACSIDADRLHLFVTKPLQSHPSAKESLLISQRLEVPLHPRYTFFWERLSLDDSFYLREAVSSTLAGADSLPDRLILPEEPRVKLLLETLCIPHTVEQGKIMLGEEACILVACLGVGRREVSGGDGLDMARSAAGFPILPRGGTFVGARMGRPEKAKRREMRPLVHSLFPVGLTGKSRRDIMEAAKSASVVEVELVRCRCRKCGELTYQSSCPRCGGSTSVEMVCVKCGKTVLQGAACPACAAQLVPFDRRTVALGEAWANAVKHLQLAEQPKLVKGVRGLTSGLRYPERLEKGILRARHDLSVFKDGTTRFDATNAPLTHVRAAEVGVTVEKLHGLGYDADVDGYPLERPDQIVPLQVQDIIVNEACGDYLVRVASFVDELLTRFYGLSSFYNVKSRLDLVGHLVVGLSPHTSVGVVGRIVGYTKAKVCFAHPFWHASKRRDCDGDEDSVSLLLDVLLNFSRSFLPSRIGGMMDAPLLLTVVMNPAEVARQAFNLESVRQLPLRFYEEASRNADPKALADLIDVVSHRLGSERILDPIDYTHEIADINAGTHESVYSKLPTMMDKMAAQLGLAEKIQAVVAADVARRVLSTHLMRDLIGNLRAFSTQRMRCMKCNSKFRRPPLRGVCSRCGGKIAMTVYRGTIEKYLDLASGLVERYDLGAYAAQRLLLIRGELASLFREEGEDRKQLGLSNFL